MPEESLGLAGHVFGQSVGGVFWWLLFLGFNVLIVIYDLRWRRVPNGLLVWAFVGQAVWLCTIEFLRLSPAPGAEGFRQALLGLFLSLIFFFPLWKFHAMGAGDVKYLSVLGFQLGLPALLPVVAFATIAAGIHALCVVFFIGWGPACQIWRPVQGRARRGIPYAAYLALAAIVWLPWVRIFAI